MAFATECSIRAVFSAVFAKRAVRGWLSVSISSTAEGESVPSRLRFDTKIPAVFPFEGVHHPTENSGLQEGVQDVHVVHVGTKVGINRLRVEHQASIGTQPTGVRSGRAIMGSLRGIKLTIAPYAAW